MWHHKLDYIPLVANPVMLLRKQGELMVFLDHVNPYKRTEAHERVADPIVRGEDVDDDTLDPKFFISKKGFQFYENTSVHEVQDSENGSQLRFSGNTGYLPRSYSVTVRFE